MLDEVNVRVGVLLLDIHIPESGSLKVKRKSIRSFIDSVKNKYSVSIAEVGALDKWQRSIIGVSIVSNDSEVVERVIQSIRELLYRYPEMELLDSRLEML
jgi:hypothetical protein